MVVMYGSSSVKLKKYTRELLLSLAKETNNLKGGLIEALEHSVQKHSQQPSEENTYKGGPKYQLSCK